MKLLRKFSVVDALRGCVVIVDGLAPLLVIKGCV